MNFRHALLLLFALLGSRGTMFAAEPAAPAPSHVTDVVIVFKTHFDIGYTDMASNVVQRYRTTMIDDALKVVELNRDLPPEQQFVWTLPGWPMSKIAGDWPDQTPERKNHILRALKDGRFAVHALPFTLHTELLEPEDLVRGLGFAARLSREVGLELPRDAKMTDVPCHAWILPTLLKHAGVDFLHLGCNAASRSPEIPKLFWWQGPDGSRLLTMYTAESYGTGLVPPTDWPYKTWLALIHTGDNHGPPTPAEVRKLLDEAKEKLPGARVRIGRLSDFADGILAERANIPVVRGDMPDTWIHGPMSNPQGARMARNIRPQIAIAESLNTQLSLWGVTTESAAPTIQSAYEQSLLYGEHTWGGALYWVTKYGNGAKWGYGETWREDRAAGRFARLESSWAEHTSYIEAARDLIQPRLSADLQTLASAVQPGGRRVVVFNPLPWKRSGVVSLPVATTDTNSTNASAAQELFLARGVPASGYRTWPLTSAIRQPAPDDATTAPRRIESRFFRATLDPVAGVIRSLVDKRTHRELVDQASHFGFGQYLYERFASSQVAEYVKAYVKIDADWATNELGKPNLPPDSLVGYHRETPGNGRLRITRSPIAMIATMDFGAGEYIRHRVTTRLILYADQPYADIEVTLHGKPADPWPEAGWISLPFNVGSPQFRLGRQGSIVDPVRDLVRGANRHLFGIDTGVALFDFARRGVGLCPLDSPLVSLDLPGCWKYSPDFVPTHPVVFVNLFNNQWTTNFRLWNEGTWTSRVRLWAFDRYQAESALITPSLEARYPLQAAVADGAAGTLPLHQSGVAIDRPGVLVTAFGANPDGDGLVLRLWELAGNSGRCRVRLPAGLRVDSIQPADLRGRPQSPPIRIQSGRFEFALPAFAPASFLISPTKAP